MSLLNNYFKLQENGTSVRTEVIAGLTTFLTMAYIIFVNPSILGDAGVPKDAVFVATCLAAAIGSLAGTVKAGTSAAPYLGIGYGRVAGAGVNFNGPVTLSFAS